MGFYIHRTIAEILEHDLNEVTNTLFHEVDQLKTALDALKSKTKSEIDALKSETKSEIDALKSIINDLKSHNLDIEIPLLTGQLAYKVERELVKRILEGIDTDIYCCTLNRIDDAIQHQHSLDLMGRGIFKSEEQRRKAIENWKSLNSFLHLDRNIYFDIEALKQTRNQMAHPDLTLDELLSSLKKAAISKPDDWKSVKS